MTTLAPARSPQRSAPTADRRLWRRWVAANALGELVGLGLTGAAAAVAVMAFEPTRPTLAVALVVASGAIEGIVVGVAQWRTLRERIPVPQGAWVGATVVGALVAWAAGSTPMLLLDGQGATAEPSAPVQLALAAALGLVAGPVLGGPQALTLRRLVPRAWRWVAANAVAWACALPITFVAPALLPATAAPALQAGAFAIGAFAAGAIAGAIHGVALVALAGGRVAGLLTPLLARVLRSPAGRLMPTLALLVFTGRRSGRRTEVVVGAVGDRQRLVVIAADATHKQWWRNFAEPRPVEVHAQGRCHTAVGHRLTAGPELTAALRRHAAQRLRFPVTPEQIDAGTVAVIALDVIEEGDP